MIKLYSYFRSSSSYRVRIALNLKQLDYSIQPVHLIKEGGEQFKKSFTQLNAASKIPVLQHDENTISQSLAIIEYLEECFPQFPLFPKKPIERALTRQLCEIVNSDIQPLQNLSVLKKLVKDYGFSDDQKLDWIQHWISLGFHSFENLVKETAGDYCIGDQITAADCFLIPQIYNANRFQVDMSAFPTITKINDNACAHDAFITARPDQQPDFPKE